MKRETVTLIVVFVAMVVFFGIAMGYLQNTKLAAKNNFEAKLALNWKIAASVANNIQIQAKSPDMLVHFAREEYRRVQEIHFPDISSVYQSQAEEFQQEVSKPLIELLREISGGISDANFGKILRQAQSADDGMKRFYEKHPGVIRSESIATLLDANKSKIVKATPPKTQTPATRIIVVDYPTWVQSQAQKQAWDTMYSVTRDYFNERKRMQKVVNWQYGSNYNAYFTTAIIRQRLSEGISERETLLTRLSAIERVEGMSGLSSSIKEMLNNSIQSLNILRDSGDYARFKYLNNQNDRIQAVIRRQFGIR